MSPRAHDPDPGNLWLARSLWDSGAVQFGTFDLGATLGSPIYINARRLIGNPHTLRRIGELLADETRTLSGMLHPHLSPFELVAGVPLGGLHLATAFSLTADVPLIYPDPRAREHDLYEEIEGAYFPGQTVLLIDDLITGGSSVVETVETLRSAGLMVHDAIVLIDRQAGGQARLAESGIRLHPLLKIESLLNYLVSRELITQAQYARALTYVSRATGGGL
ncbi:MAG: phosphoribosyltransferase family protein [Chloroflexota bacterium]|nr:phosphoribosyltransferase family protein [Chloroflexota bacterium]